MPDQPVEKKRVHWAVQAWVVFHLFMITSWALPKPPERLVEDPAPKSALQVARDAPNYLLLGNWEFKKTAFHYYLDSTGFWQYWNMFSPNPANTDVWIDAIVTFEDGTEMLYKYPRMHDLGIFEKYFKERYRKFVENVHPDVFSYKWPALAQGIAYQSYRGDGNLPTKVVLRRHFKTINPPGQFTDPEYKTYAFFTYFVDTAKIESQVHG